MDIIGTHQAEQVTVERQVRHLGADCHFVQVNIRLHQEGHENYRKFFRQDGRVPAADDVEADRRFATETPNRAFMNGRSMIPTSLTEDLQ